MNNLLNHTALVTGASSGIGRACAQALSDAGLDVSGIARDFSKISDGILSEQYSIDLSDLDGLPKHLESLDLNPSLLVLAAGYGQFGGLEQFSYQQIRQQLDTNLIANLFVIKHFLPIMKVSGGGDIVLIGSEAGLAGAKQGAVYCAGKFALRGLAQSLRADCATSNIRVILLNPGPVATEFFDDLNFAPAEGKDFAVEPADVAQAIVAALSQPRNSVLEEINLQPIKRAFVKK